MTFEELVKQRSQLLFPKPGEPILTFFNVSPEFWAYLKDNFKAPQNHYSWLPTDITGSVPIKLIDDLPVKWIAYDQFRVEMARSPE